MNKKRLRTSIAAAMGGALLLAGLLVGASLALAQESDEPEVTEEDTNGDSLNRAFGYVQDLLDEETESAAGEAAEEELARIAEQLQDDLAPLIDQIRELAYTAIDEAAESGALTEEQAERARDRVEGFAVPEAFPFLKRGFRFVMPPDFECFGFHFDPDGLESSEDCPEFELPEGFPFGTDGFEFGPLPDDFEFRFGPLERFGERIEDFVEGLDIDLDELRELMESGMTLDEALQELGTDLESLAADAREQAMAQIDQMVEEGDLTEEQATRIKELLESIDLGNFPFGLHRFDIDLGEGPGFGGWGQGHGFFGHWDEFFDDEEPMADNEEPMAEESLLDT